MKVLLPLAALLLAPIAARAAEEPCYQYGPNGNCLLKVVPVVPDGNGGFTPLPSTASSSSNASVGPTGTANPSATSVQGADGAPLARDSTVAKDATLTGGALRGTVIDAVTSSTPTETNTTVGTTAANFGSPGTYRAVTVQAQGQEMCVTFGAGTLAVPSGGACAVGMHLAAGQGYTYPPTATPSSQGRAIAAAVGGTLWESVQ
jgi:hypothetical protein